MQFVMQMNEGIGGELQHWVASDPHHDANQETDPLALT